MKKITLILTLLLSGFLFEKTEAQIHLGLNVNINSQPIWGPVGYDHVEYYYMPDIDVYYNVPNHQYIYLQGGHWMFASSLPSRFHNYDLYSGYKVVVNEPKPYLHAQTYRTKYAGYKGNHSQQAIRNSHDSKYFGNKNHPEHGKWQQGHNKKDDHNNHH